VSHDVAALLKSTSSSTVAAGILGVQAVVFAIGIGQRRDTSAVGVPTA